MNEPCLADHDHADLLRGRVARLQRGVYPLIKKAAGQLEKLDAYRWQDPDRRALDTARFVAGQFRETSAALLLLTDAIDAARDEYDQLAAGPDDSRDSRDANAENTPQTASD